MPIKDWEDIHRVIRVGTIHLGEKVISKGKEHPKALPYFRVPDEIKEYVGDKPDELEVYLASSDHEECFPQYYERWGGSKDPKKAALLCRGDGRTADRTNPETEKREVITCEGKHCELFEAKKCRRVARLLIILPDVPGLGAWQISTGSFHGVTQINSMFRTLLRLFGRTTGIPLKLSLHARQVAPDGKPKTVYVMQLDCPSLSYRQALELTRTQPLGEIEYKAVIERPDDLVPKSNRSEEDNPNGYEDDEKIQELLARIDWTDAQKEATCREYADRRGDLLTHLALEIAGVNRPAATKPGKRIEETTHKKSALFG